jgi:hypothetical protein
MMTAGRSGGEEEEGHNRMKYLPEEREVLLLPSIRVLSSSKQAIRSRYCRNKVTQPNKSLLPEDPVTQRRTTLATQHARKTKVRVVGPGVATLAAPQQTRPVVQSLPNHFVPLWRILIRARVSPLPMASPSANSVLF